MKDQEILLQLRQLPDELKHEVLDFIGYLLVKHKLNAPVSTLQDKKQFGIYKGVLKSGLSIEEIDEQLSKLRSEWERPIS